MKKRAAKRAKIAVVAAPPPAPAFSASQIPAWILVLAGLWECFRAFPGNTFKSAYVAAYALGLGVLALFWGLKLLAKTAAAERDGNFAMRLGMLALFAVGLSSGWNGGGEFQLGCVVLGGLIWLYLSLPSRAAEAGDEGQPAWAMPALLGIVAFGAFLRFHQIMDVPFGLNTDEVFNNQRYKSYLENGWHLFFTIGGHSMVAYHSIAFALFHFMNKLGLEGVYALRFSSSVWGVIGLFSVFLFVRELLGWRAALWAVAFMAVSSFAILVSREDVCDPAGIAMQGFVFYFFFRGLKGSKGSLILSGLLLGLHMHGHYWPHFVAPAAMLLFLGVSVLLDRMRLNEALGAALLTFGGFGLVYINMAHYYFAEMHTMAFDRVKQAQGGNFTGFEAAWNILSSNFIKYIHFYTAPEAGNALIYNPGKPLIDPFTAVLLLLGGLGAAAAWAERRMEALFLLGYFFLILLPGSGAEYAPTVHRISNQIPALFALVGFAADRLIRLPGARPAPWWPRLGGLAVSLLLLFAVTSNYKSFFQDFKNNAAVHEYWGGNLAHIGNLMRQAPRGTELVVSDAYKNDFRSDVIAFESGKSFRWSDTSLVSLFPQSETQTAGALIFQEPSLELAQGLFKFLYPNSVYHAVPDLSKGATTRYRENSPQNAVNLFGYYEIPAQDLKAAMGQGSLWVPRSQEYKAVGAGGVLLNRKPLKEGQALALGMGFYPFQSSAAFTEAGKHGLQGADGSFIDFSRPSSFRDAKFSRGLRARYFTVPQGQKLPTLAAQSPAALEAMFRREKAALSRIEPTVFARYCVYIYHRVQEVVDPFDLVWDGKVTIPNAGEYRFYDENKTALSVWIDGALCNPEKARRLSAGDHAIYVYHRVERDASVFTPPVTLLVEGPDKKAQLLPMDWLKSE